MFSRSVNVQCVCFTNCQVCSVTDVDVLHLCRVHRTWSGGRLLTILLLSWKLSFGLSASNAIPCNLGHVWLPLYVWKVNGFVVLFGLVLSIGAWVSGFGKSADKIRCWRHVCRGLWLIGGRLFVSVSIVGYVFSRSLFRILWYSQSLSVHLFTQSNFVRSSFYAYPYLLYLPYQQPKDTETNKLTLITGNVCYYCLHVYKSTFSIY